MPLPGQGWSLRGDRSLEVGNAQVGGGGVELGQGAAPDVGEVDWPGHGAVGPLRQADLLAGVRHPGLVQPGFHRVRQDLVDPPPCHDVTTKEQSQGVTAGRTVGVQRLSALIPPGPVRWRGHAAGCPTGRR